MTYDVSYSVADYLNDRMKQIRVRNIFGVPGNFVAPLLNTIEYDQQFGAMDSAIRFHSCTNENIAAYAAEGAARAGALNHPSALFVTAGVGSLSAMNPIAGCFMEKVPLLVINGVFTFEQRKAFELTGMLSSHMLSDPQAEASIMGTVCAAVEVLSDPQLAPAQIDSAILMMLRFSQPVYLEISEDIFRMECARPAGTLDIPSHQRPASKTDQAIAMTLELIRKEKRPLIFAGAGISRWGLQDDFAELLATSKIPYVTSLLSKSILSEDNPNFVGQFSGKMMELGDEKEAYAESDAVALSEVQRSRVLIQIGVAKVTVNYGGYPLVNQQNILVGDGSVMIGTTLVSNVDMGAYIRALTAAISAMDDAERAELGIQENKEHPKPQPYPDAGLPLGYSVFGQTLDAFINKAEAGSVGGPAYTLVSDAGFVLRTVTSVHVARQSGFYSQADWLAIGFSTPAALGIDKVETEARTIVAVGDGAFQETATAVSDLVNQGSNAIVLILDNGLHGVEQVLVNPNPFRKTINEYPRDRTLERFGSYNLLHPWAYDKLAAAFGAVGARVENAGELRDALLAAEADTDHVHVIQVVFERGGKSVSTALPASYQDKVNRPLDPGETDPDIQQFFGEDEYLHPNWPKW